MGRLFQQNRQQAKTDSRRFSKGTVCRILYGDFIVDLLIKNRLVPPGILFVSSKNGEKVAACIKSNRVFTVPVTEYNQLDSLIKSAATNGPINPVDSNKGFVGPLEYTNDQSTDQKLNTLYINQALLNFLKQNLIMVRVPLNRISNGGLIDPELYDVLVETIDLSQTIDGLLVDRFEYKSNVNNIRLINTNDTTF